MNITIKIVNQTAPANASDEPKAEKKPGELIHLNIDEWNCRQSALFGKAA